MTPNEFYLSLKEVLEPFIGQHMTEGLKASIITTVSAWIKEQQMANRLDPCSTWTIFRSWFQANYDDVLLENGQVIRHGTHIQTIEPDSVKLKFNVHQHPDDPTHIVVSLFEFERTYLAAIDE